MKNSIAIKAALEAGRAILKVYSSHDFAIETKADESPLTLADKKSNEVILKFLSETEFPVLSEESKLIDFEERRKWKTFWLVDPLDGTKEFIKRNGEFTVNIALIKNGQPVFGVIYVPVEKKLYFTAEESAFKIENIESFEAFSLEKGVKLQKRSESENFIVMASKSHLTPETWEIIDEITKQNPNKTIVTKSVGSSLKLCLVAEGEADFYPRYAPTMEWDIAAGHAICKYAGVEVVQADTKEPLTYNKENLLNPWFEVGRF